MKKLALAAVVLGASLAAAAPAFADPPVAAPAAPTAHIRITRGTNACTAPGAGPAILGYTCSYAMGTRDVPLVRNTLAAAVLPDGRTFHLTLKEVMEPPREAPKTPRRFKVTAAHRKTAAGEVLLLADITAKENETFSFRFPLANGSEAMFLDIAIN